MTFLVERLAELRAHLDHLTDIALFAASPPTNDSRRSSSGRWNGFPGSGIFIVIHEYVALDLDRVIDALHDLEPVERFCRIVAGIEAR